MQHYVIKFVSDLRQIGGFLRILWLPPAIQMTPTIVESGVRHHNPIHISRKFRCIVTFQIPIVVYILTKHKPILLFACLMVFKATFNNISVISLRSVLLVEETGGSVENHRPVASH